MSQSKGTKNDQGKAPVSLIPRSAIIGIAKALDFGAKKYDRYNFMNGIEYTRLTDATMRHIFAFLDGEDIDKESGLNHINHAAANLCMLLYMLDNRQEMDDRFNKVDKKRQEANEFDALVNEAITQFKREGFSYAPAAYHVQTVNTSSERTTDEQQNNIGSRADKFENIDGGD